MTLLSIIIFILIFSFLVIIHELGHFWAARAAGVKVEEFGLGLPPRIWGKRIGQTLYSFNWIPFGGFVKLKGEGSEEKGKDSMQNVSYGWRFLIMVGGVVMNLIGAYVLLSFGMWLGMPPLATDATQLGIDPASLHSQVYVIEPQADMPAAKAGIAAGDIITKVDGREVKRVADLQAAVDGKRSVEVEVLRKNETKRFAVPTTTTEGKSVIGVAADEIISRVKYPVLRVPIIAAQDFGNILAMIAKSIGAFAHQLFTTASVSTGVAGPVGIAKITAQAVQLGWMPVLQLMIFLSINLGLINLFPFPALDGGRLVFLIVEVITGGRKVPLVVENIIHNLGFMLLLALIVVVTYRDVLKLL